MAGEVDLDAELARLLDLEGRQRLVVDALARHRDAQLEATRTLVAELLAVGGVRFEDVSGEVVRIHRAIASEVARDPDGDAT